VGPPDPPLDEVDPQHAFSDLVNSLPPQCPRPALSIFVKKLDVIQEVQLPPVLPRMATLSLAEKGLIGQFTGLWPSPRTVQRWVERNWTDKIQGNISIRFCGKGYFTFHFESKKDKDLIFRNGPYFMAPGACTSISGLQILTLNWMSPVLFRFGSIFLISLSTAREMNLYEPSGMESANILIIANRKRTCRPAQGSVSKWTLEKDFLKQ